MINFKFNVKVHNVDPEIFIVIGELAQLLVNQLVITKISDTVILEKGYSINGKAFEIQIYNHMPCELEKAKNVLLEKFPNLRIIPKLYTWQFYLS